MLGGGLGLLLPLIASRFGIVGILILALGYCALSSFGGGGGLLGIAPRAGAGTTNGSAPANRTVIEIEPIDTTLAGLVEVSR